MKTGWLWHATLRVASLLAPADQRAEWIQDWHSELWYIPRRKAALFCLGAFRDALWLRRNNLTRAGNYLESPLCCLALLATLAAAAIFFLVCLPAPGSLTQSSRLGVRDLAGACLGTLGISCLVLPATLAIGQMQWPAGLRPGIFLALKIALVQPIMFGGAIAMILLAPVIPVLPTLLAFAAWILPLRWVFADQQRRCPVCFRFLTDPVRIGTASQTFLEWYGAESTCSRGHGLLHTSEGSASYSRKAQWLSLDDSWRQL
jgi:hypothetical protein